MLIPWRIEEHLSSDTYQHLVRIAETLNLSEGTVLITEGDQNRTLFILESGSLNVSQETSHGVQQVGIIEPGDVTGKSPLSTNAPGLPPSRLGRLLDCSNWTMPRSFVPWWIARRHWQTWFKRSLLV